MIQTLNNKYDSNLNMHMGIGLSHFKLSITAFLLHLDKSPV